MKKVIDMIGAIDTMDDMTRNTMENKMLVRLEPELKGLVIAEAERLETYSAGEIVTRIIAAHFKRPDLAGVPRKSIGRPRKQPA